MIGKDDPEYRRPGETPGQTIKRARGELHGYFTQLIESAAAEPADDLISELLRAGSTANRSPRSSSSRTASCSSRPATRPRATRSAAALVAFCEHPERVGEAARANRELLPDAVEEILRWVSPISHFTRVATEDCEVARRERSRAGDQVALYFASANRDEDGVRRSVRVPRRPPPEPAPRVRLR